MKLFFLLILFLNMTSATQATIIPIKKISEINQYLEQNQTPEKTLLVFDVDYTLVHSSCPAFQIKNYREHKSSLKKICKNLTPEQKSVLPILMVSSYLNVLIEENAPRIIRELQSKGYPVIACTATTAGSFGNVESIPQWRYEGLFSLNFDFSSTFSAHSPLVLTTLDSYKNYHPAFFRGILFANLEDDSKGATLLAFLDQINFKPIKVIMVDDNLQQLQSVDNALNKRGVPFTGLHYLGAESFLSPPIAEEPFCQIWQRLVDELQST